MQTPNRPRSLHARPPAPGRRCLGPFLAALAGLMAGVMVPSFAAAQEAAGAWPNRPIRLLVPLAAGSTADIVSRIIGQELAQRVGQPVVVENKPGAGGTIATAELARSSPDGYTIAFGSQGTLVFNQALYSRPGYDSVADIAPVALIGGVSNVMVVHPSNPAKTAADVIASARAKPGALTFSSGGSGTSHHLSGVLFAQLTGTSLLHVPYKGAPQGILAVMSQEVDVGFYNTPTVLAQIREGKLRALAVTSLAPSPLLPGVPTLDRSGVPKYEVDTWFGVIAPARTPPAVVDRLATEIGSVLATTAVKEKLVAQGFELAPRATPDALRTAIRTDLEKWLPIVKASGAKVD